MVPCKKMNEYSKLMCFYAELEESTRQKYFEREPILESLDEGLVLTNQFTVENCSSRVIHVASGEGKKSFQDKGKQNKNQNIKRKRDGEDRKSKDSGSDGKKTRHNNDTYYKC